MITKNMTCTYGNFKLFSKVKRVTDIDLSELNYRESEISIVHTNKGTIECTPDTKVDVNNVPTYVNNLKKGDILTYEPQRHDFYVHENPTYLPLMASTCYIELDVEPLAHLYFSENWAYLTGVLMGESIINIDEKEVPGRLDIKGYVRASETGSEKVLSDMATFINHHGFNVSDQTLMDDMRINEELYRILYKTLKLGKPDTKYRQKIDLLPNYVFDLNDRAKLAFLAGIVDSEGILLDKGDRIEFLVPFRGYRAATDVCNLFNLLGVECLYREYSDKNGGKKYYVISFNNYGSKKLAELGFLEYTKLYREPISRMKDFSENKNRKPHPPKVISVEHTNRVETVYGFDKPFYVNGIRVTSPKFKR